MILLATLNARYSHAALGLRYLRANLGALREQSAIREFVIGLRAGEVVERLLAAKPTIIGFAVYIWNVDDTTRVVALLKQVAPQVLVVLGGPEVSYESDQQAIVGLADYVITGPGEISFPALCQALLAGQRPADKCIPGVSPDLATLVLPYDEYSASDLTQRTVYLEASRGCPFRCEFCLSALDRTAWPFPQAAILDALENLWQRGLRRFKFVDRTFNLKIDASLRLLDFFLDKLARYPDDPVFAHFEVIPDRLPPALKAAIARFPPGTLQLEVGVQTFNPEVQARISRRQDEAQTLDNLRWLANASQAHVHADLIIGLPGEDMTSFGAGFDRLVALGAHEIQVGLLKRLRGTPIIRHSADHGLVFDPYPPYTIQATACIPFADMQRLARFARYWDLVGNSGRFAPRLPALLGDAPFARFLAFSDFLYTQLDATQRIAPERLEKLIGVWLGEAAADSRPDSPVRQAATPARQQRHQHRSTTPE